MVKEETEKNAILKKVKDAIINKWASFCDDNIEFLEDGVIMFGYRVVIPETIKALVLEELHTAHLGIVRTKSLARSYVWWPTIEMDIERKIYSCTQCSLNRTHPPKAVVNPWPNTNEPWSRIHIDFLGPFKSYNFFIIKDSYSKWVEVYQINSVTTKTTIQKLYETFARFGLPKTVLTMDLSILVKSLKFF